MNLTTSQVEEVLKSHAAELKKLQVRSLHVFGSVASGKSKDTSDIDFLVEFDKPVGMFGFLEVKYFLENVFKTPVDLATPKALHPQLKNDILKEAVRVA